MVSRWCDLVPGSLEVCRKFFPAVKKESRVGGVEKKRGQRKLWNRGVKPSQGLGEAGGRIKGYVWWSQTAPGVTAGPRPAPSLQPETEQLLQRQL